MEELLYIMYYFSISLSLLATSVQLLTIIINKLNKSFLFELISYFLVTSILLIVGLAFNYNKTDSVENGILCKLQGTFIIVFELSQYIWGSIISHSIFSNIIQFSNDNDNERHRVRKAYLFISLSIPIIFYIVCIILDTLGPSGYYCWISTINSSLAEHILICFNFLLVWITVFYNIFTIYYIVKYLKSKYQNDIDASEMIEGYTYKLILYPLSCIIIVLPATVIRTVSYFSNVNFEILDKILVIFVCLQGFIYSVAYGFNNDFAEYLIPTIKYIVCCQKRVIKNTRVHKDSNLSFITSETDEYNTSNKTSLNTSKRESIKIEKNVL